MNTSEVLNKAADLIEERGWYAVGRGMKYQMNPWGRMDSDDSFCLEGGIAAAAGIRVTSGADEAELVACPAYLAVNGYLGVTPHFWNDARDRTESEVIEVLRACAVIEASRERESAEVSA